MRINAACTLNSFANADEIIARLLTLRNVSDIATYLRPPVPWDLTLRDFGFSHREIESAIELVRSARESGDPIVVYTDYDADGITGGAILWETLHKLGCTAFPYVPRRAAEGYGFSIAGIDNVVSQHHPKLIISVDHGIAAVDQVAYIRKQGISVIITDHHQRQERLPEPDAVFHIPLLSGSGVAYYFAKELWRALSPRTTALGKLFRTDYLSFASIGSVADLVPLVGPTRSIVKYGLETFADSTRLGLQEILKEAKIAGRPITPYDIGFIIAPRINAIGRLGHALDALRLLCTGNNSKAELLTRKLAEMNNDRKALVENAIAEASAMVEPSPGAPIPPVIIVRSDSWNEGIIGLIASRLCEQYFRPAIVITRSEQVLKASCRSPATVDITGLLTHWKKHFVSYGGHHQAAGFSLMPERYADFTAAVAEDVPSLITDQQLIRTYHADMEVPFTAISLELAQRLAELEPFGQGNPRPAFTSRGKLVEVKRMGTGGAHLKLRIRDPLPTSVPVEIVAFRKGTDYDKLRACPDIQVLYSLDTNTWNGKTSVQGKLLHWQPVEDRV